ncbi:hypothetical protein EDD21DRAFT_143892 [Dissophora ornata]|nr:hypothetical protein EDD21DRAFT_143892 [Dissophora ornata]
MDPSVSHFSHLAFVFSFILPSHFFPLFHPRLINITMTWSVDCSAATSPASGTATHNAHSNRQHPFALKSHTVPDKLSVRDCHLREFCGSKGSILHDFKGTVTTSESQPLKEHISIQSMDFLNYLLGGLSTYLQNLRHPSRIPGTGLRSKAYALGLLPGVVAVLVFCQWTITLVLVWSSYTNLGKKAFQLFLKDLILLFDPTDTVDPTGTDEAIKQMGEVKPKSTPSFSYYIANLLLILSTATYERDDNLVKAASKIMSDIDNEDEKAKASKLLQASEKTIDNLAQLLGMRFMGVSELKSLGGPYAGLFYNDEMIILVYKGTSVLAFNEYLIDGTIQRVLLLFPFLIVVF